MVVSCSIIYLRRARNFRSKVRDSLLMKSFITKVSHSTARETAQYIFFMVSGVRFSFWRFEMPN